MKKLFNILMLMLGIEGALYAQTTVDSTYKLIQGRDISVYYSIKEVIRREKLDTFKVRDLTLTCDEINEIRKWQPLKKRVDTLSYSWFFIQRYLTRTTRRSKMTQQYENGTVVKIIDTVTTPGRPRPFFSWKSLASLFILFVSMFILTKKVFDCNHIYFLGASMLCTVIYAVVIGSTYYNIPHTTLTVWQNMFATFLLFYISGILYLFIKIKRNKKKT